jgi:hypothetical protein
MAKFREIEPYWLNSNERKARDLEFHGWNLHSRDFFGEPDE